MEDRRVFRNRINGLLRTLAGLRERMPNFEWVLQQQRIGILENGTFIPLDEIPIQSSADRIFNSKTNGRSF